MLALGELRLQELEMPSIIHWLCKNPPSTTDKQFAQLERYDIALLWRARPLIAVKREKPAPNPFLFALRSSALPSHRHRRCYLTTAAPYRGEQWTT